MVSTDRGVVFEAPNRHQNLVENIWEEVLKWENFLSTQQSHF